MNRITKNPSNIVYVGFVSGIFLYIGSIIWLNLNGHQWCSYDIYSDAMVAKYMSETHSIFPDNWMFGNQYYVIATPVIASLINYFLHNAFLSLGIASCIMTLLTVVSYIWCIKPFVNNKSIIVGLLCLIGGTITGTSAAATLDGLQVFFTMASYYACYVIGILFTLGLWLRLYYNKSINLFYIAVAVLLNLTLGMQSLRETLVLNIPLCMLAVYVFLIEKNKKIDKEHLLSKGNLFTASMLVANLFGVILIKLFINVFQINSYTILDAINPSLFSNLQRAVSEFLIYIGLNIPNVSMFGLWRFASSLFILVTVLYTIFSVFKSRKKTPIALIIIFCLFSLFAVFLAGLTVIRVRTIYFFVWHLLVSFSFVYVSEEVSEKITDKRCIQYKAYIASLLVLLCIGMGNYYFNFEPDFSGYSTKQEFYKKMTNELKEKNIKYLYSDWLVVEAGVVSAFSNDDIICGTFGFNTNDDLLTKCSSLYLEDWYKPENFENAYIMLSNKSLDYLDNNVPQEYKEELLANLSFEYKTEYEYNGEVTTYYFYKGSDKLYADLIKG